MSHRLPHTSHLHSDITVHRDGESWAYTAVYTDDDGKEVQTLRGTGYASDADARTASEGGRVRRPRGTFPYGKTSSARPYPDDRSPFGLTDEEIHARAELTTWMHRVEAEWESIQDERPDWDPYEHQLREPEPLPDRADLNGLAARVYGAMSYDVLWSKVGHGPRGCVLLLRLGDDYHPVGYLPSAQQDEEGLAEEGAYVAQRLASGIQDLVGLD